MAARPDSLDVLAASEVPLLVVRGDEDELSTPADADAMLGASPGARLEVLAGSGHLTALEVPAAFDAVVRDFVAGLGPKG
jgi:pimeloyl-ACP methyl ester carboxylesterase